MRRPSVCQTTQTSGTKTDGPSRPPGSDLKVPAAPLSSTRTGSSTRTSRTCGLKTLTQVSPSSHQKQRRNSSQPDVAAESSQQTTVSKQQSAQKSEKLQQEMMSLREPIRAPLACGPSSSPSSSTWTGSSFLEGVQVPSHLDLDPQTHLLICSRVMGWAELRGLLHLQETSWSPLSRSSQPTAPWLLSSLSVRTEQLQRRQTVQSHLILTTSLSSQAPELQAHLTSDL